MTSAQHVNVSGRPCPMLARKKRNSHLQRPVKKAAGNDVHVHYTFDFSQNVCLPHHARQMGPVYFASLRKVQILGFRIDNVPLQLNFLVDENETIGKDGSNSHGPNAVISMVDWALESHNRGETVCVLHADNCPSMFLKIFTRSSLNIIQQLLHKYVSFNSIYSMLG